MPALTEIFAGVPAMAVIAGVVPVLVGPLLEAVTAYTVPTVVPVVSVTVATPAPFVVVLAPLSDPLLFGVLVKVTGTPRVATGLSY